MNNDVVLELDHVSKIYKLGDQELYALKDITIKIRRGEFVAIIGPSGSGKSTFLHVASLLDKNSEGVVKVLDVDVTEYNEVERAQLRNKEIGFIFQQFNLLPKTSAIENAALPLLYAGIAPKERNRRGKEMLELVGLGTRLNNTPAQLSGGQQQRVAIARALINNPTIIFADEPTGNLDTKSGADIKRMIIDFHKEGRTIILVTHDPEMAKLASRVIVVKDGEVVEDKKQIPKNI
jgi:putative ABC transport system ATP-binding protein